MPYDSHLGLKNSIGRHMLEIFGKLVILREFTDEHLNDPKYFCWLRDVETITWIYRLEYLLPLSFSTIKEYVDNLRSSGNDCFFAIHESVSDEFIGTQRIGHVDWRTGTADMGILIGDSERRGSGYASDALRVAIGYAFKSLSLRRLTGGTPESNTAMCKCFERVGFKQEGRLRDHLLISGQFVDHLLYGLLKKEIDFEHYK